MVMAEHGPVIASGCIRVYQGVSDPELMTVPLAVQHMPDPTIDPLLLEIALALLGAMLGGLLLTPIMRITRSFASAVDPPEWGQDQMALPSWLKLSLHLNIVLPAVATVIWVSSHLRPE